MIYLLTALITKVIVSVQQQNNSIIVILCEHQIFVKNFQSIRRMSQMVHLAVISYLKEMYNLYGEFCSDEPVLSFKMKYSNKYLLFCGPTLLQLWACLSVITGSQHCLVLNWYLPGTSCGKNPRLFCQIVLRFMDRLNLKTNWVLCLAKIN